MESFKTRLVRSPVNNPWKNLAWEEYLVRSCADDEAIFYLWQNDHTVVIGRNQNAWAECHIDLMEREGVTLARRSTGGGAVYHDLGNLNFSFVLPRRDYNMRRQLNVILTVLRQMGINADFTGRNDLTVDGRKFSGNAYQLTRRTGLHHGTILVRSDMTVLPRYLNVDLQKLKSKGVKSVASRVINLTEVAPTLTIEELYEPLEEAFLAEYGRSRVTREYALPDDDLYRKLYSRYSSRQWLLGRSPQCEAGVRHRFPWGGVQLCFDIENAAVENLRVYSDAMDGELILAAEQCLGGKPFDWDALSEALKKEFPGQPEMADMADWLGGHPSLQA
ncbi:MAG: lipoate--protein ligase [Pyramidobacter sp.]|jgi:lipoate-protein ligase A